MNKTILIMVDGCRPDALVQANTPSIDYMIDHGSHTLSAQTVTPSITLPVHFSIFTSMLPMGHGVLTNTGSPQLSSSSRGIVDMVKDCGKKSAFIYSWGHLRNLSTPSSLDYGYFINSGSEKNLDIDIAMIAADCLRQYCPDFCFIYLEGVDIVGHEYGFMSDKYIGAIEAANFAVDIILNELERSNLSDKYNIILHSDHGGIDKHHIKEVPEVMTIPWIAYGPDVKQNHVITSEVSVIDTAPTLAKIMGVPKHHTWRGNCVDEILA